MRHSLTQTRLKEILEYNPISGIWYWKHNSGSASIGKRAGCINPKGYKVIRINGYGYEVQYLAWLYMTGEFPPKDFHVDHIDTDVSNNSWDNYRLATMAQQQWNVGIQAKNTSGVKGVTFNKQVGKWIARIQVNNKRIHLGYFKDITQAEEVIKEARYNLHGEYANNG